MDKSRYRQARALIACVVGLATGYSVFVAIAFGLFVTPLSSEFGWSRTEVSLAFTICTFVIVLLAPFFGALTDRYGARAVIVPAIGAFGVSLGLLSLQDGSLWALYALYVLAALAGAATLPAGYSRVVVMWFTARRGLALSVALSGVGISAVVLPPVLEHVIATAGWRTAYLALAAACLFVTWPIVALWLRERSADEAATLRRASTNSAGSGTASLLRDAVFARLGIAGLLLGFAVGGVLVHLVPLLTERLGSTERAAYAFSVLGLSTLASRIGCGYLLDLMPATRVALAVFLVAGIGVAWIALGATGAAAYAALLMLGIGFGADFDVISYLVSRYFPLQQFARTYGLIYSIFLVGIGIGSAVTGVTYDLTGDYVAGFLALAVALIASSAVYGTLGPYRH